MYQLTFNLSEFLTEHWHQKPAVIKSGFADFVDPISPDELAGLAMEEEVDSRFVSNKDNQWSATHGPLPESHFETLDESHWQLIVQACNHWHLGSAEIVEPFKQLPQWLFDDLMVCFCAPEGGVGPHIDQYDVFIIQGSGKRRWRVGDRDKDQYKESIQAGALKQIEGFDPIIDEILEPGDILYIPPGFPHEGNTIEASMSYSIGFRSPKEQELLSNFADYVLAHDIGDVHLHNRKQSTQVNSGEIKSSDLSNLTAMLAAALSSEKDIQAFMGAILSQSRHQLDIVEQDETCSVEEVSDYLRAGGLLNKVSGLRALYHEHSPCVVYINGEDFTSPSQKMSHLLCNQDAIEMTNLNASDYDAGAKLLAQLVNKGYWYFE